MREPAIVASVLGAGYASLRDEAAELEAAGVEPFLAAGCDTLIVHQESCPTSTGPSYRSETSAVGPA